jgi:hypothetical protein
MNLGKKLFAVCCAIAIVGMVSTPALAQSGSGTITGRAMDATGALIPGVEINLSSPVGLPGGDRGAFSNESGVYRYNLLVPATYTLTFTLPGFATLIRDEVRLTAGTTLTIDARLEVATVAETITVTGDTPAVDLESAQIQTNFDESLLEDIPSGRNLRSLMAAVPGFYTRALDVGGSGVGTGTIGSFRAYGDSGQSYFLTDGVYTGGHYSDFGAYSEIQIVPAAKGANVPNPGVYFNAVIRGGGNDFHGYVYTDYEDDSFQWTNVSQELKDQGLEGRKFSRYQSFNGEISGPILRDRAWFFISHYDAYNGEPVNGLTNEAGVPVDYYTRIADPTYKFSFQITDNNKLETMGQFGWKHQPYRSANQFRPSESARDQASWSVLGNVKLQSIISPTTSLNVQFSRWGYWWPSYAQVRDVPYTQDLTTGYVRGSLSENYSKPTRWQWDTTLSVFTDAGQGDHEFKIGWGGWYYAYQNEIQGYATHQQYIYRSDGDEADPLAGWPEAFAFFVNPERVTVQNTPYRYDEISNSNSLYINDRWNIVPRFTFTWGIRWDYYDSKYPAQGNAGIGPYAEAFTIPARDDFTAMSNVVPRLSFVYDLTGNGTLALKASYGRYYGDPGRGLASRTNPGNQSSNKTYCAIGACPEGVPDEAAWGGEVPYIPDVRALTSTGGARDRDVIDPVKNNYLDEVTLGLDFQMNADWTGRVNVVRKWDRQGSQTLNAALPYEAYTQSVIQTDPFDGKQYEIWSIPTDYPTFGQRIDRYQNYGGHNSYLGYEVTVNKRMSDDWQILISGGHDYRQERCTSESFSSFSGYGCGGGLHDNPNEALYDPSLRDWEWNFKAMGIYELPGGLDFSSIWKSQSGQKYGRQVRLRDSNNRTVTIAVDRNKHQLNTLHLLDIRLAKLFQVSDNHSIEANFDLFNSLNSSAVVALNLRSGSTYQRPSSIVPGRIIRLGVRWKF